MANENSPIALTDTQAFVRGFHVPRRVVDRSAERRAKKVHQYLALFGQAIFALTFPVDAELRASTDWTFGNNVGPSIVIDVENEHAVHSCGQVKARPTATQIAAWIAIPVRTGHHVSSAIAVDVAKI